MSESYGAAKRMLARQGCAPVLLESLSEEQVAELAAFDGDPDARGKFRAWLEDYRDGMKASVED